MIPTDENSTVINAEGNHLESELGGQNSTEVKQR